MDGNETRTMEVGQKKEKKGIYGSTLKLIAIFIMLIDHTAATILDRTLIYRGIKTLDGTNMTAVQEFMRQNGAIYYTDIAMRYIGRIAFPIFCFLLVEGFIHTRNKWNYTLRLAIFSLISEIPFDLAFKGKFFDMSYQNVFFTLTIGMLVMTGFWFVKEKLEDKKWLMLPAIGGIIAVTTAASYAVKGTVSNLNASFAAYGAGSTINLNQTAYYIIIGILGLTAILIYLLTIRKSIKKANVRFADLLILVAGMVLATLLKTDYSAFGILTIAVVYGLRRSPVKAVLGACITLTIMTLGEITAFFALIPAALYNGQRGLKLRYVFYIFYPAHLLILYLICYFMGIA